MDDNNDDDDQEILTYGATGKVALGDALRMPQRKRKDRATHTPCSSRASTPSTCSSGGSDYSTSSEGVETRSQRRKRLEAAKRAANRLLVTICSSDEDDDFMFITSAKKPCLSPSSRSPSPLPPPLSPLARDKNTQQLFDKANKILSDLKFSDFLTSEEPLSDDIAGDDDDASVAEDENITLRLRHRGKIHKYSVKDTSPLLQVCDKLAVELGVASKQIMLSHDTDIVDVRKSPKVIGLSTVDIIDAILLTESETESLEPSNLDTSLEKSTEQITFKILNSNKDIAYSLRKSSKALKAFAAELGVDVSKIAFSCDGEVIGSGQIVEENSPIEESPFPPEWEAQTQNTEIFPVARGSDEWNRVEGKFLLTMPHARMVQITRIQNTWLWEKHVAHKERLRKKNNGNVNELELFHGTCANEPKMIYEGETGFDMRYCFAGVWGQANYFAVNASYSNSYAHLSSGYKEMFLVRVLAGDSYQCVADGSLRMPPLKAPECSVAAGIQFAQMRYDTVTGATGGSQVYMTYDNDKAYPAYLLQYLGR